MSTRTVTIPSYRYTQVNKGPSETHAETILTPTEVIHQNLIDNIEAFDKSTSPDENAIYIFVREKMENGDWKYACASIPTEKDDTLIINIPGFKKLPTIFMNVKEEVIKVVRKVVNNLAFI